MTFCLGIHLKDGLVGIADTRVTSGSECITARKLTTYHFGSGAMFIMTSGLRSVRDKCLTYFNEVAESSDEPFARLFQAVNVFAAHIRRVAEEDRKAIESAGMRFNAHALIGGQLSADRAHKLYLVYPEGNWVEVGPGTPYHIIGSGGYGKPVLDRTLNHTDPVRHALKVGCLAFDSTRISAADVDFPIDVVLYEGDSRLLVEHRFEKEDLREMSAQWQELLRLNVGRLPAVWMSRILDKLPVHSPLRAETPAS
jgi:putative proteasome-type protease